MKQVRILLLLLCLLTNLAMAGTKVVMNSQSNGCEYGSTGTNTMYLRSDIMRIDMKEADNSMSMIFKKSEQKMWIINHQEKKYQSITKGDLEKINSTYAEMRETIEEQLKNMPEEQREQMRKMMTANNAAVFAEPPKVKFEKKSETMDINGWSCANYHYSEDEVLKSILWVAPLDVVKVNKEDFQIMHDFSDFLRKNLELFSLGASSSMVTPEQPYEGIPVRTINIDDGKACTTTTIQSVEQLTLENDLFVIPKEYRREENPLKGR